MKAGANDYLFKGNLEATRLPPYSGRFAKNGKRRIHAPHRGALSHALRVPHPDGILIADNRNYYLDANPSNLRDAGLYPRGIDRAAHFADLSPDSEVQHIASGRSTMNQRQIRLSQGVAIPAQGRFTFRGGDPREHDAGRQFNGDGPRHHRAQSHRQRAC